MIKLITVRKINYYLYFNKHILLTYFAPTQGIIVTHDKINSILILNMNVKNCWFISFSFSMVRKNGNLVHIVPIRNEMLIFKIISNNF